MKGRHALITSGATGLGYAIAKRLLASGASVTLWDCDSQALGKACTDLGRLAHRMTVDVADHTSVVVAMRNINGWSNLAAGNTCLEL